MRRNLGAILYSFDLCYLPKNNCVLQLNLRILDDLINGQTSVSFFHLVFLAPLFLALGVAKS